MSELKSRFVPLNVTSGRGCTVSASGFPQRDRSPSPSSPPPVPLSLSLSFDPPPMNPRFVERRSVSVHRHRRSSEKRRPASRATETTRGSASSCSRDTRVAPLDTDNADKYKLRDGDSGRQQRPNPGENKSRGNSGRARARTRDMEGGTSWLCLVGGINHRSI